MNLPAMESGTALDRGTVPQRVAGRGDPAHCCPERRVLKLEMNAQARTEARVATGDPEFGGMRDAREPGHPVAATLAFL